MAAQYSYSLYNLPEIEFRAEELQKRLRNEKANYACVKFIRSVERCLSFVNNH